MNSASATQTKVLRLRLKDKHAKVLGALAREVNFVWNYCNELQVTMFNRERRFLSGYDFAKFTRGRWYLNACVAVPMAEPTDRLSSRREVGIDLGLRDLVATSDGEKLLAPQFYRGLEAKLAIAQRARKKDRVRAQRMRSGPRP
jgi:hypothetical protein